MNFQLDSAKEVLQRTPATLNALLSQLPEEWVLANEGPDTWTPFDIIGHLIHAEETDWLPRLKVLLHDGATGIFEPFDRFAMFEKSQGQTFNDLLRAFEQRRAVSLKELDALDLTPDLYERQALHPELGKVTLAQLLSTWVVHDLGHIAQIVRVMAKHYQDDVGAWRNYLSILNR